MRVPALYSPLHVRIIARLQAGRAREAAADCLLKCRLTQLAGRVPEGTSPRRPGTNTQNRVNASLDPWDEKEVRLSTAGASSRQSNLRSKIQLRSSVAKEAQGVTSSQPSSSVAELLGPPPAVALVERENYEKEHERPVLVETPVKTAEDPLQSTDQAADWTITGDNGKGVTLPAGAHIRGTEGKQPGGDQYTHIENDGPMCQSGNQARKDYGCRLWAQREAPLAEKWLTENRLPRCSDLELRRKTDSSLVNSREPTVRWGRTREELARLKSRRENYTRVLAFSRRS